MDLESPHLLQVVRALKQTDFELAYLAVLSEQGLKPLSRWEKPIGKAELELLEQMGLEVRQVHRTVKTGKNVIETVFGRNLGYLNFYERQFAHKAIDKSPQTQLLEGYLFGYPPCCIQQYIRQPYRPNDLPAEKQKILFHWACYGCRITPVLLAEYELVHRFVQSC